MGAGIYIHIPFCIRKCPYCDFYSVLYEKKLTDDYVKALCCHIKAYREYGVKADTIYFGGGTPSLLKPKQIDKILSGLNGNFNVKDAEITLEANPSSVDYEKLCEYRKTGINRISFGVQSADNRQLRFLGRLHDFDSASRAVYDAQRAGFDDISCDIMLGLSGQDMNSLNVTIDRIASLPIKHISAYMLKIEEGTAFDNDVVRRSIADEDLQCDMYLNTVERLDRLGFEQYEISNFAKEKRYSRHNMKYWQGEEYIGFGPAAHSYFNGQRFCSLSDIMKYIENPLDTKIITENNPDKTEEYIMLSLRLKRGISLKKVCELGGEELMECIKNKAEIYSQNRLCVIENDRISLTPKGFLVSNSIIASFLESGS
ncbi:MAG: radical SAM family heme chaperone HemW [Ruminococcus sp.]|nr:radical SAM family heme chaperone HemW [Ruminococcus sp.]